MMGSLSARLARLASRETPAPGHVALGPDVRERVFMRCVHIYEFEGRDSLLARITPRIGAERAAAIVARLDRLAARYAGEAQVAP
jgi:hypothetical protein